MLTHARLRKGSPTDPAHLMVDIIEGWDEDSRLILISIPLRQFDYWVTDIQKQQQTQTGTCHWRKND